MIENTQIDRSVTYDVQSIYRPAIPESKTSPAEPAHIEIHNVSIGRSTLMYSKAVWEDLAEEIMEEHRG